MRRGVGLYGACYWVCVDGSACLQAETRRLTVERTTARMARI